MYMQVRSFAIVIAFLCASLLPLAFVSAQVTNAEERAALQAQLDQIERDIANNQGSLTELQKARTTLERDISILDTKIAKAKLQIKQTDLTLKAIHGDIVEKVETINQVDAKVTRSQASLAQILRKTREIDDRSFVALTLAGGSISDAFEQIDEFEMLQRQLDNSFSELGVLRDELSDRKAALEDKKSETEQVRGAQVLAKQAVERDEAAKKQVLTVTKGQEKTYQQIIADKQKQAAQIRARLFGLRDSGAIPFGTAYEYAKAASVGTGVSPALILAILTQETNLGANQGSCYVTNLETGAGKGKNTGKAFASVMKAPRDTVPFKTITESLGRDWSTTAVSCPQSVGYGGAMGPSQFIPSTWVMYKNRLATLTGEATPDPWNARTAIFATALLMEDNGADGGTRTAERTAALKYFAGGNWAKAANAFYGDSVMELRDDIQSQIDIIK